MLPTLGEYVADCTLMAKFSWILFTWDAFDADGEKLLLQDKLNGVAKAVSLALACSSVHPWQSRIEGPKEA